MVHNPGPGPSVSGPDTSGWRTYQQRQAPSPDHTRHCPLCEDHARRAAAAEVREDAAYAALEWLRSQGIAVQGDSEPVYWPDIDDDQTACDFWENLSAATGRELQPPDNRLASSDRAARGQAGETEPARLDWLYAQGVRACDARCEPDTRPGDMFPEVWDGSWEYTQDKTAFLRGIGIGIQWAPCDHPAWEPAALEWLRQGGIRVKAGVVDWRGSEVQPGAEFYAAIDAALQKLDKEAGAGE